MDVRLGPPALEKPATIHDVASLAGVSVGTASKALNGQGRLRVQTIERVRDAAAQLEYRPNELMQSVLRKRTHTVGLLTTETRFSIAMLQGIEDALAQARFSVFLCMAAGESVRERQHIDSLLAKHVDGIIVVGNIDRRSPISLGRSPTPVVYAYTYVGDRNALCLLPDNEGGARLATEHLLRIGRRRLAHITGPGRMEAVCLRRDAMRTVLEEHALPLADDHVYELPPEYEYATQWRTSWGYQATHRLLDVDPQIDGLFCGNDELASGAVEALRERGRRIPDDVAVVGFDNWELFVVETRPPLTSVDMRIYELGHRAGSRLLALIGGERESGIVRLPCQLVVRESTVRPE
jgi:LacI family transcriptional regulator